VKEDVRLEKWRELENRDGKKEAENDLASARPNGKMIGLPMPDILERRVVFEQRLEFS